MGGFVGLQTTLFLNTEQGRVQTKAGASRGGKVFTERQTLAAKCSGVRRLGTALASTSAPSSDTRKRRASFCPVTAALWMACIPKASRVAQQAWGAGERRPCVRSGDLPAEPRGLADATLRPRHPWRAAGSHSCTPAACWALLLLIAPRTPHTGPSQGPRTRTSASSSPTVN